MKEFKINIFSIFYLILYRIFKLKLFKLKYLSNDFSYKKQVFIDCGFGYFFYYIGIVKYIQEHYNKEQIDNIVWVSFTFITSLIPSKSIALPYFPVVKLGQ